MGRHGENIRKRSDGRWEGRYKVFDEPKGRYLYRSVYGHGYEDTKEKLAKARLGLACQTKKKLPQKQDEGESSRDSGKVLPFSQAAGEWLEKIAEKRKHSTYVKYETVYKTHLTNEVGSCQLSAAAAAKIKEKIFDHISGEAISESLQKSILCIANQILDFAGKKYGISVPRLEKPSIKSKKKPVPALSRADQARLLSGISCGNDKFNIAVLLCLYTGLRLGELCALQWADLDIKGMTLMVSRTVQRIRVPGYMAKTILLETDPKSESSKRTIPLTGEMVELLIRLKGKEPYIFGGEKPLEPRTMQYQFQKLLKEAGIGSRNFHILRHTFATNCVESSMDVKSLSELLGHSDVKITLNRYVHPTMAAKRKQLGLLSDFYGQICGQAA